jgi:HD superfamily phosphodiesterase
MAGSGAEQAQAQQASAAQRVGKQAALRKRLEKLAALHEEFQGGRHTFKARLEVNRSVIYTDYVRNFP